MLAFLTPVAAPLGISNPDFAVAAAGILLFGAFAFLWSSKSYSAFFWAVVWIGIYVVLQTLLWPAYQSPETAKILNPWVSKFLIWSSAYLIPILFFLWPVNGGLKIKGFANTALRAVESGLVALFAVAAVLTSGFGFMSQTYVFTADTAFTLLKDSADFTAFVSASKALSYLSAHMQAIVVSAVLFAIYKAFFSEIVSAAVAGAVSAIMKRMKKWWGTGTTTTDDTTTMTTGTTTTDDTTTMTTGTTTTDDTTTTDTDATKSLRHPDMPEHKQTLLEKLIRLCVVRWNESASFSKEPEVPPNRSPKAWTLDFRKAFLDAEIGTSIAKIFWDAYADDSELQIALVEIWTVPMAWFLLMEWLSRGKRANALIVRKSRKKDGLCNIVEWTVRPGVKTVLFDDTVNSWNSL